MYAYQWKSVGKTATSRRTVGLNRRAVGNGVV
jgi:hypothetical protein